MRLIGWLSALAVLISASCLVQTTFARESQKESAFVGAWTNTVRSTNALGEPCPFVPETLEFYKDQTVTMSDLGEQHLPFKTVLTKEEKAAVEKRFPDFKGKSLLLIKPNPSMNWTSTPMVYAYSLKKNELTLFMQNWTPAKFVRKAK